jgi:transposase-like protein
MKDHNETASKDLPFDLEKVQALFKDVKTLDDITKPGGFLQEIMKGTVERLLKAEMEHHLGYPEHAKSVSRRENTRNGYSRKTLNTSQGDVEIDIPRDVIAPFSTEHMKRANFKFARRSVEDGRIEDSGFRGDF